MSKFNSKKAGSNKTVNKEGYVAYKMRDEEKLVSMVLTSFFNEKKFYGDNSLELVELAEKVDSVFVAKLSLYARKEMHLRSVSHVLTAVLAKREDGKKYVRYLIGQVVERPDDMTEVVSCYLGMYGKPLPNSLKKGIADCLNSSNEYGLGKYAGKSKDISIADLVNLTHPKPIDQHHSKLFKDVLEGTLKMPVSWETELSSNGNNADTWKKLLSENKLGYMAMLRNMRNIIKANPANVQLMYDKISDKEQVLKSKQLPFRFYSAYKSMVEAGLADSVTVGAIEKALDYSVENVPKLKGNTLIAIDVSGSMTWNKVSNSSDITSAEIAALLGAMAGKVCDNSKVTAFDHKLCVIPFSPNSSVLQNARNVPFNGGSTHLHLPLKFMLEDKNFKYDRLIILSDNVINGYGGKGEEYQRTCQVFADKYRNTINPDLWVHAIDLVGYGTQQFIGKNTNILAGWGEKIFDFIHYAEDGYGNTVAGIKSKYNIFDKL